MGDSSGNVGEQEESLYESIRSRPVTPSTILKVNAGAKGESEDQRRAKLSNSGEKLQTHKPKTAEYKDINENYGLKILGCKGINERPVSAKSRLLTIEEEQPGQVITTTDEQGDTIEVSDSFQKLKIARNQPDHVYGAGDGPDALFDRASVSSLSGITIRSLASNEVFHVPETHRSNQGSKEQQLSSENETRVHPNGMNKSKLSKTRRRRRITKSIKSEQSKFLGILNSTSSEGLGHLHEQDQDSDVGGSDRDYSAPSTARTLAFDEAELLRPETASSEILGDGTLATDEGEKLNTLKKIFGIQDDDDWYSTSVDINDNSGKNKTRQLIKLFYRIFERSSEQGIVHTHKLMLGGLHNRLEDFVLLPVPPGFNVKMRITRVKKGVAGRFHPIYYLHLERETPGDRKCLIMVAKKHTIFGGTGYILSTDPAELCLQSEYCVGKITSNFVGTEFTLFSGRSICSHIPLDRGALMALPKTERFREELATVLYDPNVLGFKGPRKIKVVIPKMKNLLEREVVCPRIAEESLLQQQNMENSQVWCLKNKDPIWNRDTHAYILNFNGRVTKASVKNFQIVGENNEESVLFQFGRASENTFSMDFQYPFCPMQAFAIALTSFDSKLACE